MEYQIYINEKKQLYNILLQYIESEEDCNDEFESFLNYINSQNYLEDKDEFEALLRLIMAIYKNIHRMPDVLQKFDKIFQKISDKIKQTFSNLEIFKFCKKNKLIILYFIKNQILTIDEEIYKYLIHYGTEINGKYFDFFYPEIKQFVSEKVRDIYEKEIVKLDQSFEEKRQLGENDTYICSLIRDDSVEDFIKYVNKNNISVKKYKIMPSIYETNSFLLKNDDTSLIEYSAFYGSIQIFQYLRLNNVELRPSLWLYAIHGRNPEMIHFLEEDNVMAPNNDDYSFCLGEAIKCHHNELSTYIKDNLLNDDSNNNNKIYEYVFHFYNYCQFPEEFNDNNNNYIFFYMCRYNYSKLVNLYLKSKEVMFEQKKSNNIFFLKIMFYNH